MEDNCHVADEGGEKSLVTQAGGHTRCRRDTGLVGSCLIIDARMSPSLEFCITCLAGSLITPVSTRIDSRSSDLVINDDMENLDSG